MCNVGSKPSASPRARGRRASASVGVAVRPLWPGAYIFQQEAHGKSYTAYEMLNRAASFRPQRRRRASAASADFLVRLLRRGLA